MKRFVSTLAVAAAALAIGTLGPAGQLVAAATPPPPPPTPAGHAATAPPLAPSSVSSSVAVPLSGPSGKPGATPTPPPDESRKGLDGVWEVAIQTPDGETHYVHFKLTQKGSILAGNYLDNEHNNKQYPAAGAVDGTNFHLVVTKNDGSTITFEAQVDGTTDMVGLMKEGSSQVAFTAAYRPKYKFIDNIAPGIPGGLGGGLGGGGTGGGPP